MLGRCCRCGGQTVLEQTEDGPQAVCITGCGHREDLAGRDCPPLGLPEGKHLLVRQQKPILQTRAVIRRGNGNGGGQPTEDVEFERALDNLEETMGVYLV